MSLHSLLLSGKYVEARILLNRGVNPPPNVMSLIAPEEVDLIAFLVREDYEGDADLWSYRPHCYVSYLLIAMYKLDRVLGGKSGEQYSSLSSLGREALHHRDQNLIDLLLCLGWNPLNEQSTLELPLSYRLRQISAKPTPRRELHQQLLTMDLTELLFLYLQRDALIAHNTRTWSRYYHDFEQLIREPSFWRQRLATEYPHVIVREMPQSNYPFYLYCLQRLLPKVQVKDESGRVWTLAFYYYVGRGFAYSWALLGKRLEIIAGDLSQYTAGTDDRLVQEDGLKEGVASKEFSLVIEDLEGHCTTVQFDEEDFWRGCLLYCHLSGLDHQRHIRNFKHYRY